MGTPPWVLRFRSVSAGNRRHHNPPAAAGNNSGGLWRRTGGRVPAGRVSRALGLLRHRSAACGDAA